MKNAMVMACLLGSSTLAAAQAPTATPVAAQKMQAARWLAGQWRGQGWMMGPQGQKRNFNQTELISLKLNKTVLQIEGIGTYNADTVHHALAMLTYDAGAGKYTFTSYTRGMQTLADAEVQDKKLVWRMSLADKSLIRYTIVENAKGQWFEVGERSTNGGQSWQQFFEMTLNRASAAVAGK